MEQEQLFILLLVVTIFIAPDTKGSRSWLILGPVSLQPAEFAKFATALALAKYMSAYSFTIKSWKSALMLAFLILLPMTLIILQRETGSALVYMAFFLMLYRCFLVIYDFILVQTKCRNTEKDSRAKNEYD